MQGDKYKWAICAFKLDGTCALIEYGACLTSAELYEMMADPRTHHGNNPFVCLADPAMPLQVEHGLIDSGHDTFNIYEFCIRTGWIWWPSKGVGNLGMTGRLVDAKEDFYNGEPILRYHYNDFQVKVAYYKHKIARAHEPRNLAPRLYFPEDIEDDFICEQISESLGPRKGSGSLKVMEWHHDKTIGPNDWGDAMKMQFVIWQIVGPGRQAEAAKQEAAAAKAAGNPRREYTLRPVPAAPPEPVTIPVPAKPLTVAEALARIRARV